jgi:long-subunit acyl-CoA synthetase (AMP-forming)
MSLFELASKNRNLKFIDERQEKYTNFNELNFLDFADKGKALAFLYLDNSIEAITMYWSLIKSKHALCLLDPKTNEELKAHLEIVYQPKYIYDVTREKLDGYCQLDDLFVKDIPIAYEVSEKLKLLLSTSGTTGSPKLVKLSEDNLIENASSIVDYLPINADDVIPLNLPIFYSYGLSILNSNSIKGGKIVCTKLSIMDQKFWQNLDTFKYTTLAGVPYMYEMLNRIGFLDKEYPSLKYLTQAGGKLNSKLIEKFSNYCDSRHIELYIMYGQTEATARISYLHPDHLKEKMGSIGKPILNGHFEIDKETNELLYEGPNVYGGYAKSIEDLSEFNDSNLLKTGDIAYQDEDGFYFIKGRIKRFLKLFGKRVNLDDLEDLCKSEFKNRIFAVIGIDEKKIVVFYQGEEIMKNSIRELFKNRFSIHPSYVKENHIEAFPLTSNGKINYTALKNTLSK